MQALQQFLESACRQLNQYLLLWEYEKRGRMKYKFIAEGENCDTCNKLNGKVFDIKDAKVGVNLQPMHPNCDCMTGILDANGIIIALLSNKEKGKDGKNVLMELIAGKQFSFGQNPQLNLLNGNATNAGLSVLFDLPFVEWAGDRFTGVTNRENDAREHNTGDIIFGVLEAIDENNFGGAVQWVTEHFRGNATRNCESEYDYYLGRTIGNAISILVGAGTTASGVAQIIGSIVAGGAISIGSGGTLAAGGVSISIAGVTAGAATVAYGGTVVTVSAAKFGDDFDKMQAAAAAENRTSGNSSADTDSDKIPQEAIEKGAGITKVDINQKPIVSNEKLKNIVDDLYKGQGGPNTIGNGTTMDAVRNEIITGNPTNGKFHTQKLNDYLNALQRRLRAGDLNAYDTSVVNALIEDIIKALNGQ